MEKIFILIALAVHAFAFDLSYARPSDRDVLDALQKRVAEEYHDSFKVENYKRLNGYWEDHAKALYIVECSYYLVALHPVQPNRNWHDIPFLVRIKLLKNGEIETGERFMRTRDLIFRFTEKGWRQKKSLLP